MVGRGGLGRRDGSLESCPRAGESCLELLATGRQQRGRRSFRVEPPGRLPEASPGRLGLGLTSRLGATDRGGLLAPRPARGSKVGQLGFRVRERPVGLRQGSVQVVVPRRQRDREVAPAGGQGRLGRGALVREARLVAPDRLELAGQARVPEPELGHGRPGGLVGRESLALGGRPRADLVGDGGRGLIGGLEIRHRAVGLGPLPLDPRARDRRGGRRLVPARLGRDEEGGGELVPRGAPGRLLLGLRREPSRLGPELREDVLDPGEVRLGLGQLLLGLSPAALVAPDPGNLLEQRPALLGPEGEGLVDHPLADEQERVVGQMGAIEQVDEVAEPDPLLVQQVVVLAAPVQPAAELQDGEVDRQEAVGVVQDQRDVGHAERRPLLRAGEDHVLGLPAAEGPALLAERPAQRVGEIALARAVRTHDGADPRAELDDRPLREGLEALQAEREEPGRRGHPTPAFGAASSAPADPRSMVSDRSTSIARCAAAVSAIRRDEPLPTPSGRPSTRTSTSNSFS